MDWVHSREGPLIWKNYEEEILWNGNAKVRNITSISIKVQYKNELKAKIMEVKGLGYASPFFRSLSRLFPPL